MADIPSGICNTVVFGIVVIIVVVKVVIPLLVLAPDDVDDGVVVVVGLVVDVGIDAGANVALAVILVDGSGDAYTSHIFR